MVCEQVEKLHKLQSETQVKRYTSIKRKDTPEVPSWGAKPEEEKLDVKAVLMIDSADNTPIRLLLLSEEFDAVDDADCSLYRFSLYKEFDMHDTQLTVEGPCRFELSAKEIDSAENTDMLVSYVFTASSESDCTTWIDKMLFHRGALHDCETRPAEAENNQQDQTSHDVEKESAEAQQQSPACTVQLREYADPSTSVLDASTVDLGATEVVLEPTEGQLKVLAQHDGLLVGFCVSA